MQHHAADQLDVEVAHADGALRGLAHARERLGQEVVEILALVEALAELLGLGAQSVVGERGDLVLEGVDLVDALVQPLEGATLPRAQDLLEDAHEVGWYRTGYGGRESQRRSAHHRRIVRMLGGRAGPAAWTLRRWRMTPSGAAPAEKRSSASARRAGQL